MNNKNILIILLFFLVKTGFSQERRVITTAVPFLMISADARASGLGEQGVATTPDAFSQHWNPSKYVFSESKSGFGLSYTPSLSNLVNDISLGNITYYNRLSERSAFAVSFKYFSLGEIEIIQNEFSEALIQTIEALDKGGRLAVISFHSIEDRIVKQFIHKYSRPKQIPKGLPIMMNDTQPCLLKDLGKVKPSNEEIKMNRRSRSAILRIAEKC